MDLALTAGRQLVRRATAAINSILGAEERNPELPGARAIRDAVELEFGIRATRIRAIHSRENGVWHIDSPQGSWVAKVFPPADSFEREHRELRLYRWLSAHDVCVPKYRTRLQGGELAELKHNGRTTPLVLMPYERIRHLRPDRCAKDSIDSVGREIATAHAKLQDYPDACELTPDLYGIDAPDAAYKPGKSFHALQVSQLARRFSRSQLSEFKAIDCQVEEHLAREELPANLTRSVIHGDLYLANISLQANGSLFLFDWEPIQAPVVVDLATLSVNLFTAQDISLARWKTLLEWLLAAYTSRMTITDHDIRSIPLFTLRTLSGLVGTYCEPSADFARKSDVVKRCYQLADSLLREEQCL